MSDDKPADERAETGRNREPEARVRKSRLLAWVWLVPIAAACLVAWLAWGEFENRGPTISITFETASGIDAGRTKIRHKNVDVGIVESVKLSDDMKLVRIKARLDANVGERVTASAKFWVVRPRLSPSGVSGLDTLVSGAFIEMDPGDPHDKPEREFTGLEEPPIVQAGVEGSSFVLHAQDLGSLDQGSPVYYRGISVGEVLGDKLRDAGRHVDVIIYVRKPYDRLVHPESRFWNTSGISISAGSGGIKASTQSLQALLAGGIAFDTADAVLGQPSSPEDSAFTLYPDQDTAQAEPNGPVVTYLAYFDSAPRGLLRNSEVDLHGLRIGRVTDVHVEYDVHTGLLRTPVTFELDPTKITILHPPAQLPADLQAVADHTLEHLIADGLRAKLETGSLITGNRYISLDFAPEAQPARLVYGGAHPEVPTVSSGDLDSLMASANRVVDKINRMPLNQIADNVHDIVDHLDKATAGPELKRSIRSLDKALADIDTITAQVKAQIGPLMTDLNGTLDAAHSTLDSTGRVVGNNNGGGGDLAGMIRQVTETARSIRSLVDYLDQHPEALLQGRASKPR